MKRERTSSQNVKTKFEPSRVKTPIWATFLIRKPRDGWKFNFSSNFGPSQGPSRIHVINESHLLVYVRGLWQSLSLLNPTQVAGNKVNHDFHRESISHLGKG